MSFVFPMINEYIEWRVFPTYISLSLLYLGNDGKACWPLLRAGKWQRHEGEHKLWDMRVNVIQPFISLWNELWYYIYMGKVNLSNNSSILTLICAWENDRKWTWMGMGKWQEGERWVKLWDMRVNYVCGGPCMCIFPFANGRGRQGRWSLKGKIVRYASMWI